MDHALSLITNLATLKRLGVTENLPVECIATTLAVMKRDPKSESIKQLADYLTRARLSAGLRQVDVANSFGYTTSQFISDWERGVRSPPATSLKMIAKLYRIDIEILASQFIHARVERMAETLREALGLKARG